MLGDRREVLRKKMKVGWIFPIMRHLYLSTMKLKTKNMQRFTRMEFLHLQIEFSMESMSVITSIHGRLLCLIDCEGLVQHRMQILQMTPSYLETKARMVLPMISAADP